MMRIGPDLFKNRYISPLQSGVKISKEVKYIFFFFSSVGIEVEQDKLAKVTNIIRYTIGLLILPNLMNKDMKNSFSSAPIWIGYASNKSVPVA